MARDEAIAFASELRVAMWTAIVCSALLLGVMAFFQIPLAWMFVAGFVWGLYCVLGFLIRIAARLDTRGSYLEQCCTQTQSEVEEFPR